MHHFAAMVNAVWHLSSASKQRGETNWDNTGEAVEYVLEWGWV